MVVILPRTAVAIDTRKKPHEDTSTPRWSLTSKSSYSKIVLLCFSTMLALSGAHAQEAPKISNDEIENMLDPGRTRQCLQIPMGTLEKVVPEWMDRSRSVAQEVDLYIPPKTRNIIGILDEVGVVTISDESFPVTSMDESREERIERAEGSLGTLTVSLNDAARGLYVTHSEVPDKMACVKIETNYDVSEIIDSQVVDRAGRTYRLVRGYYETDVPERMQQYFERVEEEHPRRYTFAYVRGRKKFRILVEYDVFDKDWSFVTGDVVARDVDFREDRVSEFLDN